MKKHPDSKLTLRQAFTKHYDVSDLTTYTAGTFRHRLSLWERLTDNPPVATITNSTMAAFRQAAIDSGLSPSTVNGCWSYVRAILRRLGPPLDRNPAGLSIIQAVPWMKPCKVVLLPPRRVSLADIAAFYVACRHSQFPRGFVNPADWFRALTVTAYCTGLRRGDLRRLRSCDIDMQRGTLQFVAAKTGKAGVDWPMHPVVVEHLRRIVRPGEGLVFRGLYSCGGKRNEQSGSFYKRWHAILQAAGLPRDRWFGLHDLRRTGGSEIERVRPGLGSFFTQHAPRTVFDRFYCNKTEELREAIAEMRLPSGFRAGPKVAGRKEEDSRQARVAMRQEDFTPPGPNPADWQFGVGRFSFRGTWYELKSATLLRLLFALVHSPEPVKWDRLIPVLWPYDRPTGDPERLHKRVHINVCELRTGLRRRLALPETLNPIPCVMESSGGAWTIWLPPEIGRKAS